jgi:hypothetical protein
MLSILAESLLIATRMDPVHRDLPAEFVDGRVESRRDVEQRRKWYRNAGLTA